MQIFQKKKIIELISLNLPKKDLPVTIIVILTLVVAYFVNTTPIIKVNSGQRNGVYYEKAVVTEVVNEELETEELSKTKIGLQNLKVKITSGDMKGEILDILNQATYMYNVVCNVGTKLIVQISVSGDIKMANVYTYDRSLPLIVFIGIFFLVLCIIGGKKGVKSLVGLLYTFFCVMYLFIPLLYKGVSPILASILLAVISTFVTMLLIGGWNTKTISAITGTILCVSFAGIISTIAGFFLNISDFTMGETEELMLAVRRSGLNIKGVMFASILIASLGAIMDVCMSVASSVNEVYTVNSKITRKELFRSGINVGRDMMGTMSNTLILAFTGGFLTAILILASREVTINELLSMPSIVTEIVQGLSGSIGIFFAVPIVSVISSYLTTNR